MGNLEAVVILIFEGTGANANDALDAIASRWRRFREISVIALAASVAALTLALVR